MTTAPAGSQNREALRLRITVRGVVQGVGFRPFVHALACRLSLSGYVVNTPAGVVIEIEGAPRCVETFCEQVSAQPPPLAAVDSVEREPVPTQGVPGFSIRPSLTTVNGAERSRTLLPPDTATCVDCLSELESPTDRRFRHPFINCTHCGPRFTIVTALPYDRATTTMAGFPMCALCAREYTDPADRRFHAQPVACPSCGPLLRLTVATDGGARGTSADGEKALTRARRLLASGAIVAVKGLGGYHLACDAANPVAVEALRARKGRGRRPFAVMVPDTETAAKLARLGMVERQVMTGRHRPVVLLRRCLPDPGLLAPGVCPNSPDVGVLLPYTPLHRLLLGLPGDPPGPRILVMTSANRSGEPIVTGETEALDRLAGIADAWLWHDRPIHVPCDDSVVRVRHDGSVLPLRRSRGYAPEPVELPVPVRPALAVGGDSKNALALGEGRTAWLSAHVGDMGGLATMAAFERAGEHLRELTGVIPTVLVADRHPDYHSARWARRQAAGRPVLGVQHHHAHIASAMAEHGLDGSAPVIGIAFDGTGYGDDGAVWGGEVLLADYDGVKRLAHLAYVPLPGGEAAVRHPYRMALAHLRAAGIPWDADLPCVTASPPPERRVLGRQLDTWLACVPTSSFGRMFDAVSSLIGVCQRAGYEAQAAVELEAAAVPAMEDCGGGYVFPLRTMGSRSSVMVLDPAPVVHDIVSDLRSRESVAVIAARFHHAVAKAVEKSCLAARSTTGTSVVALSGGVFANALLDEECTRRLMARGFTVLRHRRVPPGDGGLALGQLMVAARHDGAGQAGDHAFLGTPAPKRERTG